MKNTYIIMGLTNQMATVIREMLSDEFDCLGVGFSIIANTTTPGNWNVRVDQNDFAVSEMQGFAEGVYQAYRRFNK